MTTDAFTPLVGKLGGAKINNAGCSEDFIVISGKLYQDQSTESGERKMTPDYGAGGTQQCIPGSRNQPIVNRFCGTNLNFADSLTENVPVCGKRHKDERRFAHTLQEWYSTSSPQTVPSPSPWASPSTTRLTEVVTPT